MCFRSIVTIVSFALLCVGCSVTELRGKELLGQAAPEARLMMLDGSEIPLSATRGKPTAILFWTTWCSHSRTVIEQFNDMGHRYGRRASMEFLAVSVDKNEDFETLKNRIKEQKLEHVTHIFSGNDSQDEAYLSLKGQSIPYVVFLDEDGVVRFVDSSLEPLEEYLRSRYR